MNISQGDVVKSRARSIANLVAAFALTALFASNFTYLNVIWNPGYYGELGLFVDQYSWRVEQVEPGSPADRAGIKIADAVERPHALRDRLILNNDSVSPRPGEQIALSIIRGHERRIVTLTARSLAPLSAFDSMILVLQQFGFLVLLGVGLTLVLLRPSRMTWGFFLFSLAILDANVNETTAFFSYISVGWYVALFMIAQAMCAVAGASGFLVFCVRFPDNAPTGWRAAIDRYSPYVFFALAPLYLYSYLDGVLFIPTTEVVGRFSYQMMSWVFVAIVIVGIVAFLITYLQARGLERHRIKWVGLGLACASISATDAVLFYPSGGLLSGPPMWFVNALSFFYIVLPITVAYAVIRHRVIDVRFVVSRSLVFGVIAASVVLIVIGLDWLFSAVLPASRFVTALYGGVTLLVGLLLNTARLRIGKTIDFLFFRQWHQTQERANIVADTMRRAKLKADLYEPLTAEIADAFSLTSAALFERVEDGGFVRVAAVGWPTGTIWHILPEDPLVKRADERLRIVDIDPFQWHERDLPPGLARPALMVPIIAGRRVPAILLVGAHENGTGLDPDELRVMRRLSANAGFLYGNSTSEVGRTALVDRRIAGASP